jgi:hypothetical protein
MICGYCHKAAHDQASQHPLGADSTWAWKITSQICPVCKRFNFWLVNGQQNGNMFMENQVMLVYPKENPRGPVAPEVPEKIAEDYREACVVLADSPKASAALSRRCLQNILREYAKVKPQDLSREIDEVLASKQLPSAVANSVDAIRQVGNFGAHPIKDKNTGEIVEVEPGEAEWLLDVLESLFDVYFVGPAEYAKRADALNARLNAAGKPPLKT